MDYHPLDDARRKVERARSNVLDAIAEHQAFFGRPPPHYTSFREVNSEGTRESLKIRIIRDPPSLLSAAAGDAVTNLRSALDFLACELATQNGANDLAGVEFPVASGPDEFEHRSTQRKVDKLSSEAIELIRAQKPFKGGNDLLWTLNTLRNKNIHRHLIVSAIEVRHLDGDFSLDLGIGHHTIEQPMAWLPSDQEITVLTFTPGAKLDYKLQVAMAITIRDIETAEGHPIIETLEDMVHETERLLQTFEDRFFTPNSA